jgi:hypothetical protein
VLVRDRRQGACGQQPQRERDDEKESLHALYPCLKRTVPRTIVCSCGGRVSKKRLQLSPVTADWRPSRSTLGLETFDPASAG